MKTAKTGHSSIDKRPLPVTRAGRPKKNGRLPRPVRHCHESDEFTARAVVGVRKVTMVSGGSEICFIKYIRLKSTASPLGKMH